MHEHHQTMLKRRVTPVMRPVSMGLRSRASHSFYVESGIEKTQI